MSFGSKQTQQTNQATTGSTNQTSTNNSHNTFDNTTTKDPYAAAVPGLNMAAGNVTDWMNDPSARAAYGGQRVAGMSDMTQAGVNGMFGGQGAATSTGYLNDVINGRYLDAENPHLKQLTDSIRSQVMPGLNSQFSNAGMVGSTLHQGSLARGMSDALAPSLFAQYNTERGLQNQAAGMLPGIDAARSEQMIKAGQLGEGYTQRNLDAERAAFEEAQQKRAAQLSMGTGLLGQIGQAGGTTSTSGSANSDNIATNVGTSSGTTNGTTTSSTNPGLGQSLLGVGMMGAGLYTGGMFGGGNGQYQNNGLPWYANPNPSYR